MERKTLEMTNGTPPPAIVDIKGTTLVRRPSFWSQASRSLLKARWPILAIAILLFMATTAIFAQQLATHDPNRQVLVKRLQAPMTTNAAGVIEFPLGTDTLGRDVLSRLIFGARVSMLVGVAAVAIGGTLGTVLGMIAGYVGGIVDDIIMRAAEIELAFPFILLTIMFLVILGPGIVNLVVVLGVGQWVTFARIARGQTISQKEKEYVEAARSIGARPRGILFAAILPNILPPIMVIASFNVASAILTEASLSFLGLGVPPSVPTWGGMLAESRDNLLSGSWWLALFPGLAIMFTVLAMNILGDWVRDFLDPRLRAR